MIVVVVVVGIVVVVVRHSFTLTILLSTSSHTDTNNNDNNDEPGAQRQSINSVSSDVGLSWNELDRESVASGRGGNSRESGGSSVGSRDSGHLINRVSSGSSVDIDIDDDCVNDEDEYYVACSPYALHVVSIAKLQQYDDDEWPTMFPFTPGILQTDQTTTTTTINNNYYYSYNYNYYNYYNNYYYFPDA